MAEMTQELLVSSVAEFVHSSRTLLDDAKRVVSDVAVDEFVSSKIGMLFAVTKHYCQLYRSLSVECRSQVDVIIKAHYRYQQVQQVHDQLIDIETDWDMFLRDVDTQLNAVDAVSTSQLNAVTGRSVCLQVGDSVPLDLPLKLLDDNSVTSVGQCLQQRPACQSLIIVFLRHFA